MNIKILFLRIAGIGILIILLLAKFFIAQSHSNEQNKILNQKISKKDMIIIIYNASRKENKIEVNPDSPLFLKIKEEIEDLFVRADSGYLFLASEETINVIKKKGFSVELIYKNPKELKPLMSKNIYKISKFLVPLTGKFAGNHAITFFASPIYDGMPVYANTKGCEKLKRLIELYLFNKSI